VKLDRGFDADAWYASFKAGHVFVTNGPMLDFTINGEPMGAEIRVAKGARLEIAAAAQLNPDVDQLGLLELVAHGDVIASGQADGKDRVELRKELIANRSKWLVKERKQHLQDGASSSSRRGTTPVRESCWRLQLV
jgi:hypothetical protein